jgi:hypothetical protein
MKGWGIIMRHLFHFGLFALVLAAATQADAQDRWHGDRRTPFEIASTGGPHHGPPVRGHDRYDSRQAHYDPPRDLAEIVSIARRWERATARHDRRAQSIADRQLDLWLEREIRESIREPYNYLHGRRVRALSNELLLLEQRGYRGRGHRGYYVQKIRILDELVELSERQVQRAQAAVHPAIRISLARY